MERKLKITGLLVLAHTILFAQKPEDLLLQKTLSSPIEKIYLHFDRENYTAGETAWFKVYLYSDYLPDTISTTLYIELRDDSSKLISRKILPVVLGNANGQFEIPDSVYTGFYMIRAYTPTMFHRDSDFIQHQKIFVFGRNKTKTNILRPKEKSIRIEFFPEGGNLINDLINTIAFKATDENGLPVMANGRIKSNKNEVMTEFRSYHDGMGSFDLIPVSNEKYYAELDDDSIAHKYFLPEQTTKGIVFKIKTVGRKKYFEILQQVRDPAFTAAYMIGQMQHNLVFRQDFPKDKEELKGTIDVSRLYSGILQVTVFNKDNIPLAERLIFVDNGEYIQKGELVADTVNFSVKAKNIFHINLKDTITGFISVSVTDQEYNLNSNRQSNILSTFLLTSDLKGYIHNPAYYFTGKSDSVLHAMDLLMMINGWRRFRWSNLLNNNITFLNDKDPGYISLKGQLKIKDTKKPFADKPFIAFIINPDSSRIIRMSSTDSQGNFRIDSLVFFGSAQLYFKDIRGKKSTSLQVFLSGDSLAKKYSFAGQDRYGYPGNNFDDESNLNKNGYDYDAIMKAKGLLLSAVTIKVKKKSLLQELEEKYASGLFSGMSEKTIDLLHSNEIITQENIIDYLSFRIPGLNVTRDGLDYYIYYRQIASVSSMGLIPMTLYLDEIETDASYISSIPASEVALVKVYNSFVGAVGNAAGGVLAIYTKKGTDIDNSDKTAGMVKYQGYSVSKEFYSPDYTADTEAIKKPDNRVTLFWTPQIFANSINGSIPITFYNNDRTKQFKIVVEGMTIDGKMLMIEKNFTQ